jgi:hypothetical protein
VGDFGKVDRPPSQAAEAGVPQRGGQVPKVAPSRTPLPPG